MAYVLALALLAQPFTVRMATLPERPVRLLFFTSAACTPCRLQKAVWRQRERTGWTTGPGLDKQVQVLDLKDDYQWFDRFRVEGGLPVVLLVDYGREMGRIRWTGQTAAVMVAQAEAMRLDYYRRTGR